MLAFKEVFPLYWRRAYPLLLVLGIVSLAYELFCPVMHDRLVDGLAGFLIGLATTGVFLKRTSA